MRALSRRLVSTYFQKDPALFQAVFGIPLADLKPEGLLSVRPWRNEFIAVTASTPKATLLPNAIIRASMGHHDREKGQFAAQGNVLVLSSSLQQEVAPELAGVTQQDLVNYLGTKLQEPLGELRARYSATPAGSLEVQLGWVRGLQPVQEPRPGAPAAAWLQYMVSCQQIWVAGVGRPWGGDVSERGRRVAWAHG
jgi:hypothetical protein